MAERVDIAIVGGGIAGASVAYALACEGVPNIVVLERSAVAAGASGRASGLVVFLTTAHPTMAAVLKASHDFYAGWEETIGGSSAVQWVGAARLAPEGERAAIVSEVRLMREAGHAVRVVERDELAALVPEWDLAGISLAAYSPRAGYIDPPMVTTALMNAARGLGVRVYSGAEVLALHSHGGRVTGLRTTRGEIAAPTVVLATGAWIHAPWLPFSLPASLRPMYHEVAHITPPASMRWPFPVGVDPQNGVYFRPEPGGLVLIAHSGADDPAADPERFDPSASAAYQSRMLASLARRIPALAEAEVVGGHAGVYLGGGDEFPLVGQLGDLVGLYGLWDTVGNGMTSSPGLGRALAETIVRGKTYADIAPFRPARFAEGDPITVAYRHAGESAVRP